MVAATKPPRVNGRWVLSIQVCVPNEMPDDQVVAFAEKEYPCGTENGWQIRREGNEALEGDPERVKCGERSGCVHTMLDA